MKKLSQTIFIIVTTILLSCNNSPTTSHKENNTEVSNPDVQASNSKIKISTLRLDKKASGFYAVCAEEHFGWCSSKFSTYDEAKKALDDHKASTGHTDNTVSNDCPFASNNNNSPEIISLLRETVSEKSKQQLEKELLSYYNPLSSKGIQFDSINANDEKLEALGGGGQVSGVGQRVTLGGSTAGTTITVNVGGNASVRIGMWFPLASNAAGQWVVAGPGSSTFQLNCNVFHQPPGCPQWFGQVVTITAEGINGTFPVWVSYNP
jgi:hypothetical protein